MAAAPLSGGQAEEPAKKVLVLYSFGRDFAPLFTSRHQGLWSSEVPQVTTIDQRRLIEIGASTNRAIVPLRLNPAGLIEDILQVLPATTNIPVVLGATPLARFWAEECRREFALWTDRIAFTYFNDLSMAKMRHAVETLPLNSAILFAGWGEALSRRVVRPSPKGGGGTLGEGSRRSLGEWRILPSRGRAALSG